jgi:hypothetical protein
MMIVIIVDADAIGEYQMGVWWWWWVSPYRYATIYYFPQSRSCVCMMMCCVDLTTLQCRCRQLVSHVHKLPGSGA